MFCKKCGAQLSGTEAFCRVCGERTEVSAGTGVPINSMPTGQASVFQTPPAYTMPYGGYPGQAASVPQKGKALGWLYLVLCILTIVGMVGLFLLPLGRMEMDLEASDSSDSVVVSIDYTWSRGKVSSSYRVTGTNSAVNQEVEKSLEDRMDDTKLMDFNDYFDFPGYIENLSESESASEFCATLLYDFAFLVFPAASLVLMGVGLVFVIRKSSAKACRIGCAALCLVPLGALSLCAAFPFFNTYIGTQIDENRSYFDSYFDSWNLDFSLPLLTILLTAAIFLAVVVLVIVIFRILRRQKQA